MSLVGSTEVNNESDLIIPIKQLKEDITNIEMLDNKKKSQNY